MAFFEFNYSAMRIFIAWIANLFWNCECKKANEQIVENRIESDSSEAGKFKFTQESRVFFITILPT